MYITYRHLVTAYKQTADQPGLRFMGCAVHSDPDLIFFRKFTGDFTEYVSDQTCFDKEPRGKVDAVNGTLQFPKTLRWMNDGQNTDRGFNRNKH